MPNVKWTTQQCVVHLFGKETVKSFRVYLTTEEILQDFLSWCDNTLKNAKWYRTSVNLPFAWLSLHDETDIILFHLKYGEFYNAKGTHIVITPMDDEETKSWLKYEESLGLMKNLWG